MCNFLSNLTPNPFPTREGEQESKPFSASLRGLERGYKQEFEYALIGSFISAAEEFNAEAEKIKVTQTQTASELWQQAVEHLKKVPKENPRYLEAQKLSASYQVKLKTVVNS